MSGATWMNHLTWTCHICKRERPDLKISVHQRPLVINGLELGKENVRYCNDNPACRAAAPHFSFIDSGGAEQEKNE